MLAPDSPRRSGIATALFNKMSDSLARMNFQYMYAVIVDTNDASLAFHRAMGFTEVGHFKNVGIKKGNWLGIVWMNKFIGKHSSPADVPEPVWFPDFAE